MNPENLDIHNIIKNTEFSEYLSDDTMQRLSKIMVAVSYEKSSKIYLKNNKVTKFLIIYSGKCQLTSDNQKVIRELYQKVDILMVISLVYLMLKGLT